MKTICAWCGEHISGDKDDPDISHGICPECKKKVEKEWDEYLKKKRGDDKKMNYHSLQYGNDAIPLCPHKKETRGKWMVFLGYDGFGYPYFESEDHTLKYCISQIIESPKKTNPPK